MSVRNAQIKDIKEIVRINRDSWLETYPNEVARITRDDVAHKFDDLSKIEQRWVESLESKDDNAICYIYEDNGQLLGYCVLRKTATGGYLNAIYINQALRHQE
jgi:hypothetical protein